jgi:hypothetical protein
MRHINISRAISLAALAAGLGTSAFGQVAPYESYQEQPAPNKQNPQAYFGFDLDFSKKSANPNIDYPSFSNPRNPVQNVRYMPYSLVAGSGSGACFEISSNSAPAGSDLLLSVQNAAGNWVWLADDNAGNGQFFARIYVPNGSGAMVRISEYVTWISEGQQNTVNQANIGVVKVNADPGSAVTASSCRLSGKPFWQSNLNSGNPYNPS